MTRPRIRLSKLHRATPEGRHFLVSIYDHFDRLVCWCGPYTHVERDACINLFRNAGWRRKYFA